MWMFLLSFFLSFFLLVYNRLCSPFAWSLYFNNVNKNHYKYFHQPNLFKLLRKCFSKSSLRVTGDIVSNQGQVLGAVGMDDSGHQLRVSTQARALHQLIHRGWGCRWMKRQMLRHRRRYNFTYHTLADLFAKPLLPTCSISLLHVANSATDG